MQGGKRSMFKACLHCLQVAKKSVSTDLTTHKKWITVLSIQHNNSSVFNVWHIEGHRKNINKEDRVKGISSWSHGQSFQWTEFLQGRGPPQCYYSKQTLMTDPAKIRNDEDEERIWGWTGPWVASFTKFVYKLSVLQISAKWSKGAPGQVHLERGGAAAVSQIRLNMRSGPAQADAFELRVRVRS